MIPQIINNHQNIPPINYIQTPDLLPSIKNTNKYVH
jgi:hypothetical protein